MIMIRKLFDKEYYFRKYVKVVSAFCSESYVEHLKFIHRLKAEYFLTFHEKLHINNPKNFNEKLIWLSLYWRNPLKVICADKYKIRQYVVEHHGLSEDIFVPLIGVYNRADEINFEELPDSFVLKCNHGCGYNYIVKDKSCENFPKIRKQLDLWLSETYRPDSVEDHYGYIKKHVILCEKMIPSLAGRSAVDYKVHCFNGEPKYIATTFDRDELGNANKEATFSIEWKQLYYLMDEKGEIGRPKSLEKMLDIAKILSREIPYVRVDFYDVEGKPYLGEMTFTPMGNMNTDYTKEALNLIGGFLDLPPKYTKGDAY